MRSSRSTRRRRKPNRTPVYILFTLVFAIIILTGFFIKSYLADGQGATNDEPGVVDNEPNKPDNSQNDNNKDIEPEPEPEPEPETFTKIRIAAAGDIMFHSPQITSAYDPATGTYDFKSVFEDVKPYFDDADLAIANFETTTAGPSREFTGYPIFNTPDEAIDALKYAGIDVLTTANNHSLDTGIAGLNRTLEVIRDRGLSPAGTFDEHSEGRVLIEDVEGIKVAILAYTENTNGLGDLYSADDLHAMLNMMEKDIIQRDINEAKELEADLIITYMHWGHEYWEEPNDKQVEFAEFMASEGVDVILGSHPHVIQRSELIEVDDHQTFVIYSMGNFISNQRRETLGDHRELTEDGVIVNFDIEKNDQTGETRIVNVEYVPTWVYRNVEPGDSNRTYRILPIENFIGSPDISDEFKKRMERSQSDTVSKLEMNPFEEASN